MLWSLSHSKSSWTHIFSFSTRTYLASLTDVWLLQDVKFLKLTYFPTLCILWVCHSMWIICLYQDFVTDFSKTDHVCILKQVKVFVDYICALLLSEPIFYLWHGKTIPLSYHGLLLLTYVPRLIWEIIDTHYQIFAIFPFAYKIQFRVTALIVVCFTSYMLVLLFPVSRH